MSSLLRLSTIALAIASADARWFKRIDASTWTPAQETVNTESIGISPTPTTAPEVGANGLELHKRYVQLSTQTCGYISGLADSALVCGNGYACAVFTAYSIMGCCPPAASVCSPISTCYDRTESAYYSLDNTAAANWCSGVGAPYCAPRTYDHNDIYSGLTNWDLCEASRTVYDVFFEPTTSIAKTTSTPTPTSPNSSPLSATSTSSASVTPMASDNSPSPTPIGAIVGGVVGGVAVIAIVVVAILLFLRHKKKNNNHNKEKEMPSNITTGPAPPQPPAPAPAPAPAPVAYGGYPAGFAAVDNSASTTPSPFMQSPTKSMYEPSVTVVPSVPISPVSPTPSPFFQPATMQPAQPAGSNNMPPAQFHSAPSFAATELPTERGDGQVRELA